MMTSMGIDFPDDHIRITPRTGAELDRATHQEIALMILAILADNRRLYSDVREAGYRSSIRRVITKYDIFDPKLVIDESDVKRWKRILKKIFIPAENEHERRLNRHSSEKCRLLRLLVQERYPAWREMLVNHPEYSEYNQALGGMTLTEIEAMLKELKSIEEMGVVFTDDGEAVLTALDSDGA